MPSDRLEIPAPACLPDEEVNRREGHWVDDADYDVLLSGGRAITRDEESDSHTEVAVLKPDGSPLVIYRHNVLPRRVCQLALNALGKTDFVSQNRGAAAGVISEERASAFGREVGTRSNLRYRPRKLDGSTSRTSYAVSVPSGIVGYYDRQPRMNYCRATAFNIDHQEEFEDARPLIVAVDRAFRAGAPDRYAAQQAIAHETHPDWVIRGTTFSTITVNPTWRTALHRDRGDYEPGFGVLTVLEHGRYRGGYLVFPRFRVAVDIRTGGVCLADVHELHGNTPIVGETDPYLRLSLVLYYRTNMRECGSATEERERAKRLGSGELVPQGADT